MPDTAKVLRSSETRMRFIAGGHDRTCPPEIVERLAAAGTASTFCLVEEAAHSNHHRVDPEGFRALVAEALNEARPDPGT